MLESIDPAGRVELSSVWPASEFDADDALTTALGCAGDLARALARERAQHAIEIAALQAKLGLVDQLVEAQVEEARARERLEATCREEGMRDAFSYALRKNHEQMISPFKLPPRAPPVYVPMTDTEHREMMYKYQRR